MASSSRRQMMHTSETAPPSSPIQYRHPLDTGDQGTLVLWAQSRLTEHGDYTGALDGRYRHETSLATRRFQARHGLFVTGVIDRRTWDLL